MTLLIALYFHHWKQQVMKLKEEATKQYKKLQDCTSELIKHIKGNNTDFKHLPDGTGIAELERLNKELKAKVKGENAEALEDLETDINDYIIKVLNSLKAINFNFRNTQICVTEGMKGIVKPLNKLIDTKSDGQAQNLKTTHRGNVVLDHNIAVTNSIIFTVNQSGGLDWNYTINRTPKDHKFSMKEFYSGWDMAKRQGHYKTHNDRAKSIAKTDQKIRKALADAIDSSDSKASLKAKLTESCAVKQAQLLKEAEKIDQKIDKQKQVKIK